MCWCTPSIKRTTCGARHCVEGYSRFGSIEHGAGPSWQPQPRQKPLPIPAGAILSITNGEYSTYYIQGVFRALKEIDTDAVLAKWREKHPNGSVAIDESSLLAWLSREGFIEAVDSWEWNIGSDHVERAGG